jgi:hypothetical protein
MQKQSLTNLQNKESIMNRRQFITATAAATALLTTTGFAAQTTKKILPTKGELPKGPVSLYYEFRVVEQENDALLSAIKTHTEALKHQKGFLSLSLKQMSGDSTAVHNYPSQYKGILGEAFLDGVAAHTQPYFYSLFVRFSSYSDLLASKTDAWFTSTIVPLLHGYFKGANGLVKAPSPMAHYRGVYETIAAGNHEGIFTKSSDLISFLKQPVDGSDETLVTVANHVMVNDATHQAIEGEVVKLLTVAQQTFQPMDDPKGLGLPGTKENTYYRRALSTEILRNAFPDGALRAYLLHGVWLTVWDHENSHLDPRFVAAITPVAGAVVVGPVEPFYKARITIA